MAGVYLDAVNASYDKYAGAYLAGDTVYMAYQMQAYLGYLALYDQALRDLQSNLNAFGALVDLSRFTSIVFNPNQLIALQQQVALNGFGTGTNDYFVSLGYTPDELLQLQREFIEFNPYSLKGTALDALNLMQDGIALASSLPDPTGSSVPEPSTVALLLSVLASVLVKAKSRRRELETAIPKG